MDYIREELLRQRNALANLLLGGRSAADEATEGMGSPLPRTDMDAAARKTADPGALSAKIQTFCIPEGDLDAPAADGQVLTGEAAGGILWENTPDNPQKTAQALQGQYMVLSSLGGALRPLENARSGLVSTRDAGKTTGISGGRLSAGGTASERTVVEFWTAENESALGPEALSRAYQRDARRYDGGFFPY